MNNFKVTCVNKLAHSKRAALYEHTRSVGGYFGRLCLPNLYRETAAGGGTEERREDGHQIPGWRAGVVIVRCNGGIHSFGLGQTLPHHLGEGQEGETETLCNTVEGGDPTREQKSVEQ